MSHAVETIGCSSAGPREEPADLASGVRNNVPPTRLRAVPIELTVQSSVSPCRAPAAGTVAVTMTSATFLASLMSMLSDLAEELVPINCRAVARLRIVGRKSLPSPVPFRPITSPKPCNVFSSCPLMRQIFFSSVRAKAGLPKPVTHTSTNMPSKTSDFATHDIH